LGGAWCVAAHAGFSHHPQQSGTWFVRMSTLRRELGPRPANFLHMGKAEQFREFAEECERLARQATADHHRKILLEMAKTWRKLANETDRKETT
jgi:hypothetical protein